MVLLLAAAAQLAAPGWAAPFPDDVALAPETITQVQVDDPWSRETRLRVYALGDFPSRLDNIIGELFHDSPLPAAPIWYAVVDRFPTAEARRLAESCASLYSEPWNRIGCVSQEIWAYFEHWHPRGPRTWCMYHAQAFQDTFMALNLPGTWASKVDASGATVRAGHVANAIMVHGSDGRVYSYVIDSSYGDWLPGRLFPLNDAAIAFHDRDHDGHTDFARLPAIASRWPEGYRAAP